METADGASMSMSSTLKSAVKSLTFFLHSVPIIVLIALARQGSANSSSTLRSSMAPCLRFRQAASSSSFRPMRTSAATCYTAAATFFEISACSFANFNPSFLNASAETPAAIFAASALTFARLCACPAPTKFLTAAAFKGFVGPDALS